jgi:hypothetical protein
MASTTEARSAYLDLKNGLAESLSAPFIDPALLPVLLPVLQYFLIYSFCPQIKIEKHITAPVTQM